MDKADSITKRFIFYSDHLLSTWVLARSTHIVQFSILTHSDVEMYHGLKTAAASRALILSGSSLFLLLSLRTTPMKSPFMPGLSPAVLMSARMYSRRTPLGKKKSHRIRSLFFMLAASWGLLLFVTSRVNRKAPKTTFTHREYEAYEMESGLKRRLKLITREQREKYKFYAVPYCSDVRKCQEALEKALGSDLPQKIINPTDLITKELEEEGKYSYLLEQIKSTSRQLPPGLLTALVKQEVQLFTNTSNAQFDTNIFLMNYPQTTEEAIKFENDIADFEACLVTPEDFDKNLVKADDEIQRTIKNVYGYFEILDKFKKTGKGKLE